MTTDIRRIVVGIDGSDNARRAAEWAAALARALDAEVVAVSALGLLARTEGGASVPAQANRDEIRTTFERSWCAPLAAADVTYRLELRDGSPVPVLLGVADEVDADVIALGAGAWAASPTCFSAARARRSPSTRAARS